MPGKCLASSYCSTSWLGSHKYAQGLTRPIRVQICEHLFMLCKLLTERLRGGCSAVQGKRSFANSTYTREPSIKSNADFQQRHSLRSRRGGGGGGSTTVGDPLPPTCLPCPVLALFCFVRNACHLHSAVWQCCAPSLKNSGGTLHALHATCVVAAKPDLHQLVTEPQAAWAQVIVQI